ncbi:MAG: acylneuraminate cytidylyltransferase family protein [Candidatus Omnitrophota bacterium]
MRNIVAIVLARGGSKGIPGKNTVNFCGKPLLVWTLEHLKGVADIRSIWVSSDSPQILALAAGCGAGVLERPTELSTDDATSESGWLHAIECVERQEGAVDIVVAPQVTSPLRTSEDIARGLRDFQAQQCDSLFSACGIQDMFIWEKAKDGALNSVNYDYRQRKRRQDISKRYIENGSFYIFKPSLLKSAGNRLGGRIGLTEMEAWKMFEIDSPEDLPVCEALMRGFLLKKA